MVRMCFSSLRNMARECGDFWEGGMGKSVIFDLDGTLADTSADLIAAANAVFDQPWLDPVEDMLTAFQGGRAMLRLGLNRSRLRYSEADVDRLFPDLLEYYAANLDVHTQLYPGVTEALDALTTSGWLLGVCTNKPVGLACDLLERLDLASRFGAILGADSLPVRKPDARHVLETISEIGGDAARSVLIGDTETDRSAARNAGIPCILVGFGPEGRSVERLEPDAVLDDYRHLPELVGRLIG